VIIDAHGHFVPTALLEALNSQKRLFPNVKVTSEKGGTQFSFAGQKPTRPVSPGLYDLEKRKAWLTAQKIDRQVVGGWLDIFGYELPPDEGADWCRFMNENLLAGTKQLDSLAALACVPLQKGELAARVLEESLNQGFCGAMIGTQPQGEGGALDDAHLTPFWEVASARKATLFLHPMFVCGDDRVNQYDLVNAVGRLADTSIAMARLLFSGHLQKYPGVNIIVSHGGGALPYALGRFKRNNAIHKGEYADAEDSFRRLYFDTVLFEARALRFLCDVAGHEKVVLGSDHPFPIGDPEPLKIVDQAEFTEGERTAIIGGTAARLFHIDCDCH
jgi:aminocarboxymuconate-semialdehyde decarboxylase